MDLTVMAVHAHPDDEVLGTGGALARYAAEGVRTVLVTCTDGRQGDGPNGVKPGEAGHDGDQVALLRESELDTSAKALGIAHVERLGYHDSGMDGWDTNHHPEAFANVAVAVAAERLAELVRHYQPQVVITYDANGGYGHPDHIQAHRITHAATAATGIPRKLYHSVLRRSVMDELAAYVVEGNEDTDGEDISEDDDMGVTDEEVTALLDVTDHVPAKRTALEAHASQGDSAFLLGLPESLQHRLFAEEAYQLQSSTVPTPDREDDLLTGLR
ncbi:PIG-L family deacetylase [Lipingzhangella sp. LS1_29]|uniref:PIG-L family deacetylase n=1 Tax=Lipingzhangella rawalii TaxID=2055835 RepID=A0ABU2HAW3_9ACTN|nr:PIG-L family deacetylase [Lipingzhangella rawalii]MDS1272421.1 PIG-L family deacetylase [Lipingzhangella rawalii]